MSGLRADGAGLLSVHEGLPLETTSVSGQLTLPSTSSCRGWEAESEQQELFYVIGCHYSLPYGIGHVIDMISPRRACGFGCARLAEQQSDLVDNNGIPDRRPRHHEGPAQDGHRQHGPARLHERLLKDLFKKICRELS
jgi:hypothetical protein